MKKAPDRKATAGTSDELQAEYRFDYSKAKPNRSRSIDPTRLVVALDPDVAEVFTTPDAVNKVLRALIQTMPAKKRHAAAHDMPTSTWPATKCDPTRWDSWAP